MEDIFKDIRPIINANIEDAIAVGTLNAKVMPGDHVVTKEERAKYVFTYDLLKKKPSNKIKRMIGNFIVNKKTKELAEDIEIKGYENSLELKGKPFIITSNHYSPYDSLIVRHLTNKLGYRNKLSIVVNESNLFMQGNLGKILKSIDVLPYANDLEYLGKIFHPALPKLVDDNRIILIYPEQEMWPDYPYARPLMPGAYHYSTKLNIPVLPIFVTWRNENEKRIYVINVGKPIYPDPSKSLSDNKTLMNQIDYKFKSEIFD